MLNESFFFFFLCLDRIGCKIKIFSPLIILGRLLGFETPWSMLEQTRRSELVISSRQRFRNKILFTTRNWMDVTTLHNCSRQFEQFFVDLFSVEKLRERERKKRKKERTKVYECWSETHFESPIGRNGFLNFSSTPEWTSHEHSSGRSYRPNRRCWAHCRRR